jgi:hypothetical protein
VAGLDAGGVQPRWRADGRELFYLAPDLKLMAVDVKTAAYFEAGIPRPLFSTYALPGASALYDVNSDGDRFLVNQVQDSISAPATVVVNWPAVLKK